MTKTENNLSNINSKRVKTFDEPKTPNDLKEAIRAIMLNQKKEIMSKV